MIRSVLLTLLISAVFVPLAADAANGDRLDRSRLALTFSENFTALDLYDAKKNPHGRWKSNYDFGGQDDASSRTLNGEYEVYVDQAYNGVSPFQLRKGVFSIVARKNENPQDPRTAGKPYTSGILITAGSLLQRYGYFEMDAALPVVAGAWPAFWLAAPLDPTIAAAQHNGEIDVMEFLGNTPNTIYCSTHWPDGQNGYQQKTDAVSLPHIDQRHRYGVLWTADEIVWYVDDIEVDRQPNMGLNKPMAMLVNLAVGGWNGNAPDKTLPPMTMTIYHVQAYRLR